MNFKDKKKKRWIGLEVMRCNEIAVIRSQAIMPPNFHVLGRYKSFLFIFLSVRLYVPIFSISTSL